ncbi:hypothetical protein BO70DRAFT_379015 [Aspergillus heteromorphus CBS 117.55]|uniref:Uncharacterized protein n=1 Tax=Aspergillus heteromorphus CBS 117.55 TaxID=1448321 RepID=A0A317WEL6_9EURO|nr:uncharacterized protein BO70DRAFT_379015 [Aspergillus heteromorphus CBS 117.55]PWY84874.1 hypothetical protein BO70DRAFT_379015 [Aspergillus heteromorphus CBS 117.55]
MSWKQVSPTRYERSFDSLERFYHTVADAGAPLNKEHYLISCTAQLQSPLPPADAVQQAWKALRLQHPQLAAEAEAEAEAGSGQRFVYQVPTSVADLDAWATATFHVVADQTADELYERLPPSPRFHLYYLPRTSALVFRTPHWRIDGIGLLHLQSAFFQLLADGAAPVLDGSEASRLCPALDSAVAASLSPPAADGDASTAAKAELQPILSALKTEGILSLPTLPNILPTTSKRLMISLSPESTAHILAACSARNITVTAAAHAALALAALPYSKPPSPNQHQQQQQTYIGFNAFDLRKYLPPPWNSPAAAVSPYHVGLPFSIPLPSPASTSTSTSPFTYLSQTFTTFYRRNLTHPFPRNIFTFLPEFIAQATQLLASPQPDPLQAPAHPGLSSLGRVNEILPAVVRGKAREVRLREWWIAMEVIDRSAWMHVWTWEGRLVLAGCWNGAFYEEGFVRGLLEAWRGCLEFLCEMGLWVNFADG